MFGRTILRSMVNVQLTARDCETRTAFDPGQQCRYPPEIWVALAALTGVSGFMKAMSDVKTSHNQTDRLIKTRDTTLLLYKRIVITL